MDDVIRRIADAVLYEGYLLYPYRPSSVKNRLRWNFGVLYPRAYAEAQTGADRWWIRAEALVLGQEPKVEVTLRYMDPVGDTWEPREVPCYPERRGGTTDPSSGLRPPSPLVEGRRVSTHTSRQCLLPSTRGEGARRADEGSGRVDSDVIWKIIVHVQNPSDFAGLDRDEALQHSMASAHLVLTVTDGEFISLLDPPADLAHYAAGCRNEGLYPVLVGENAMLASPIILYDHPQIAPQSRGDLYDATEIDEILSLRIMTLTDEEKAEACAADERARRIIERSDALGADDLFSMHGMVRSARTVRVGAVTLRAGDRVRLRPRANADIMDMALRGKTATIDAIEQDFEDRIHLAVLVDDDPGRDLGALKQPGHRFFFSPEEVEPL